MSYITIEESPLSKFLFSNTRTAWLWLIIRVYVGVEWLLAGWSKFNNQVWLGEKQGDALTGFLNGSLAKTAGLHPDVSSWYASFLSNIVIPNVHTWSYFIVFGELLVGFGLILGAFTGIASFFGMFMNLNFLFAGTVSSNPLLFVLELLILLAWKVSGFYGLDRFFLPKLGVPWKSNN